MNRIEAIVEYHSRGKKINVIGAIISLIILFVGFYTSSGWGSTPPSSQYYSWPVLIIGFCRIPMWWREIENHHLHIYYSLGATVFAIFLILICVLLPQLIITGIRKFCDNQSRLTSLSVDTDTIYGTYGNITKLETVIPIEQVTDVVVTQGFFDKYVSGKTITLCSSSGPIQFHYIQNADEITNAITSMKKENTSVNGKTTDSFTHQAEEVAEIYCEMPKHILLCLFTFGIWYLIWIYKATRYLNRAPNSEQYNPTNKLLLCLFVPFYQIYWFYKHGQKLDSFMKARKLGGSDMATLCLILGIFIPVVACILMQDKFNQLCTVNVAAQQEEAPAPTERDAIDNLERYKDLLDKGVITQEEFDAKKKQLLGL